MKKWKKWDKSEEFANVRDGPLENLWGAGRANLKYIYSRKGKLNEKNFLHAY